MGITLILMAVRICQHRQDKEHRTLIPLHSLLRSLHRASDPHTEEGQAVEVVMFHPQYTDQDQGMTTELEPYNISSQRWVLGLGREYSSMRTL